VNRLIRIAQQRFSASGSEAVPPAGTEYNDQIGDNGMRQLLREMKAICDRNQVRFLAVRASEGSSAGDIALEGSFLANCRGAGVKAIPAADQFNGNPRRYMTVFENHSGYDFHYGPGGAAKLAEVVAPAIQKALSAPSVE
jgi:hypothetical protein